MSEQVRFFKKFIWIEGNEWLSIPQILKIYIEKEFKEWGRSRSRFDYDYDEDDGDGYTARFNLDDEESEVDSEKHKEEAVEEERKDTWNVCAQVSDDSFDEVCFLKCGFKSKEEATKYMEFLVQKISEVC